MKEEYRRERKKRGEHKPEGRVIGMRGGESEREKKIPIARKNEKSENNAIRTKVERDL